MDVVRCYDKEASEDGLFYCSNDIWANGIDKVKCEEVVFKGWGRMFGSGGDGIFKSPEHAKVPKVGRRTKL